MNRNRPLLALAASALLVSACGGDPAPDPTPDPPREKEELPAPGPVVAGVATVKMPVPLGIGTMGYGGIGQEKSVTPFADTYPGTTRQHGALDIKAVAFSRGPGLEVILVRTDTIGVFQQLREAVLDELRARTGRDLDHALVIAGNHTHSGPGRLLMVEGTLKLLADSFFPEFYDRMVHAFADAVEQALADLAPAEIGWTVASSKDGHNDRRCENDALDQVQEDGDLPIVVIRRGGVVDAVVASYAYHGTVLGIADKTLSGDMGAVVEQRVAERFDHPVTVLFFNSWGGDMSPGNADLDDAIPASPQPGGYERMEAVGARLADVIVPSVGAVSFEADPEIRARTHRARLDRVALGYDEDTFNYPYGGVYCGFGGSGNCTDAEPIEGLDGLCLAFGADEPAPNQTLFTAGRIGALSFVTGAGEWSTGLAASLLERMRAKAGGAAMFIGYANDYTGYSLSEADWWQGGYEASGALWGPKQGDYLAARAFDVFETFHDTYREPPFTQMPVLAAFAGYSYAPRAHEVALDVGVVIEEAAPTVAATDVVRFTVLGTDPWLGSPVVTLEREAAGAFAPVLRPNGAPVDSDGYAMWLDLAVEPPYAEALDAGERRFHWTVSLPVTRRAPTAIPPLEGSHRLSVRMPTDDKGGFTTVTSAAFQVE